MHASRRVILVRHGATKYNDEGRYQGQSNIPLSDAGRHEARAFRARLEELLAHRDLFSLEQTSVLTSDLSRARETAEILFGVPGRAIHEDVALREFRFGIFEGLTSEEIDGRYPGKMSEWLDGDDDYLLEGGESRAAVRRRALAAIDTFLRRDNAPSLVVVSHGGVMRQLLRHCEGEELKVTRKAFLNLSMHSVKIENGRWLYDRELPT